MYFTKILYNLNNNNPEPGPASTVKEHSLRNIFSPRGPRFDPRRGYFFSREFFAQMFDGISNYRTSSSNHATSTKKAVATTTTV